MMRLSCNSLFIEIADGMMIALSTTEDGDGACIYEACLELY